jgi:hypothetical protein
LRRGREESTGTSKPSVVETNVHSAGSNTESGVRDRGLVLLRQVELALLLKTSARVALAEGLVLGPFLGELLGETALRRNWAGPSGLVLRAGRRRGGNLTPLECLVEAVELRKKQA